MLMTTQRLFLIRRRLKKAMLLVNNVHTTAEMRSAAQKVVETAKACLDQHEAEKKSTKKS